MLFDKLRQIEERSHEIARRLSDPSIFSQQAEYARLRKEHADSQEIVERFGEYRDVLRKLSEAQHILAEGGDRELAELAQAEIDELSGRQTTLEADLKRLLLPRDPNDDKNVFVEIRAGAGGDEAALFAAGRARMYTKYAERQRWKIEVMGASETGTGGFKDVILFVQGRGAWSRLKFERGVHRVQRVPVTEGSGRIHTSTVTVAVLPEAADVEVRVDEKDLKVDVYRSSGPGGQGVNTTDSAVRIPHRPSWRAPSTSCSRRSRPRSRPSASSGWRADGRRRPRPRAAGPARRGGCDLGGGGHRDGARGRRVAPRRCARRWPVRRRARGRHRPARGPRRAVRGGRP